MGAVAGTRARLLVRFGRTMTLRRQVTTSSNTDATVVGFVTAFRPDQITGDVRQGDCVVAIGPAPAGWPGPPRARDQVVIDAKVWTVQGAAALYEGATLAGYDLHARGG